MKHASYNCDYFELRMTIWKGHIKHAKIWNYKPLDWHTWKFKVWPEFDFDVTLAEATKDIIIFAANLANKKLS
jgi:hypothetical protein